MNQLDAICPMEVKPEWTDYNGHMNVAYYTLVFDQAIDVFLESCLGMSEDYVRQSQSGPFALQSAYCYLAELTLGESFDFSARVLDFDTKRMHLFGQIRRLRDDAIAATCETLLMNVDHQSRRAAPYAPDMFEKIEAVYHQKADQDIPDQVGQKIAIRRK